MNAPCSDFDGPASANLLDSLGLPYWDFDRSAGTVAWSRSACTLLGYEFSQHTSQLLSAWIDCIDAADRGAVSAAIGGTGPGDRFELEFRIRCGDGGFQAFRSRVAVLGRDAESLPLRLVGTLEAAGRAAPASPMGACAEASLTLQQRSPMGVLAAPQDSVLVLDHAGCLLHFNSAAASDQGFDQTLVGCPDWETQLGLDRVDVREMISHAIGGVPQTRSMSMRRADGSEIAAEFCCWSSRWNGQPVVICICRDTTVMQGLQRELERREQYQRALLDNFPYMVWLKDPDSRLLAVNQAYARVAGQSRVEDLIGKTDLDFWVPELANHFMADDRAVLESGRPKTVQEEIEESGRRFWIETYKSPVSMGDQVIGTVGFARDITEQTRARLKLERSEALLRATLDATADGILVVADGGTVLTANPSFQKLWRIPDELMSGDDHALIEFVRDQLVDPAAFESGVQRLYGTEETHFDTLYFKDGRVFERYSAPLCYAGEHARVWSFRDLTDRATAQAALEKERAFLKTLIETLPDLVWLKDPDGVYLACNRRFEELYGASEAAIVGKTDHDFVAPELAEFFRANDLAAAAHGGPRTNEETLTFADGHRELVETTKTPMYDRRGRLIGVLGLGHDVTAARRSQQQLQEAAERRRQLMDASRDGIAIIGQDHRVIEANPRFAEMLGYSQEELLELHTWDFDATMSETEIRTRFVDLSKIDVTFETRHRRKDGGEYDVEVTATGVSFEGENMVLTVSRDISERKRLESSLERERLLYLDMVNTQPAGIYRLRSNVEACRKWSLRQPADMPPYRCELVSDRFCELTGLEREKVLADPVAIVNLIHPDDRGDFLRHHQESLVAVQPFHWEGRLRVDGQTRWTHFESLPRCVEAGDVIWTGILFDISRRKAMELALQEREADFHTMMDWTYDWEYWIDPDGRFRYMTPSVERVTGYRAEEFSANPLLMDTIVHPEDRHLWERHLHQHLHPAEGPNRDVAELDLRIIEKQGDIRWVNHTCRPVFSDADGYRGRRVTVRDITARKQAEDQIRHLAYFDPLTGLPNRRLLMDRLGQALITGNRTRQFGALMMLDLDHFKTLNDTKGHDIGDQLLVLVAQRLAGGVRQEDTVSRLGGDEFVVILEGLGQEEAVAASQAEAVAEKVRAALSEPYVLGNDPAGYLSTPSIGLTLFRGHLASVELLLKQADVALYQAKDAGRNAVRFFNPAMQAVIDARMELEAALRRGLEADEFQLIYQPQIDREGQLVGAESLIRWRRPGHGLISPALFIPLAEENGLIFALGQWVLDAACDQLRRWAQHPRTRNLTISVNVSARQFHQADFFEQVKHSLEVTGADPSRLKLELTESVVLSNVEDVIRRMQRLDQLGVSFSLDDFGTGYSSLSYLKRLPLAEVKIDRSFVRDITIDPNDAAIVRAILAMSETLDLCVVAEGVETMEQRDFLHESGCRVFQGYLFGKPMSIDEFERLIDPVGWSDPAGFAASRLVP